MQFSSDFIIGFPGETQKDFDDTMDLAAQVGFVQAYSFKYSPRPGTPGAEMPNQIDEEIKTKRLYHFQELINRQQLAYNQSCEGQIMPVIFERNGKRPGQAIGRTPFMQSVYVHNLPLEHYGKLLSVKIKGGYANSLEGELA
jgi:tRNA-2-methylthio-N6-dimethylallyladenosine synthase